MKAGKEVDLKQYIDIAPFSFGDYKDNYSIAAETKSGCIATERIHCTGSRHRHTHGTGPFTRSGPLFCMRGHGR